MQALTVARSERGDRRVRRARLHVGDRTSRPWAEFTLSEALRLVHLPGEDEGRVYYFRRIVLRDIPADGNRIVWQTRLQVVLTECAGSAVHGADRRAGSAETVYFESRQEALEMLLRKLFRREPKADWFWPLVSAAATPVNDGMQIRAILEELRNEPGSWRRVAQSVFTALGSAAPGVLLAAVPVGEAARWLREMGDVEGADANAPAVRLSTDVEEAIARALHALGPDDPRTMWLAVLAVSQVAPATMNAGIVVRRARATLARLLPPDRDAANRATQARTRNAVRRVWFDDDVSLQGAGAAPKELETPIASDSELLVAAQEIAPRGAVAEEMAPRIGAIAQPEHVVPLVVAECVFVGERTAAAGLFFLLNVLARLGIARLLQGTPALVESAFVARLLIRLAMRAGVDPADPAIRLLEAEVELLRLALTAPQPDDTTLLRSWSLAIRRWCRQTGRLDVRDVVRRSGRVSVTRTDLDVSLPLAHADIRIRRIGLDIDPGWLPWFGRVVRFHYTLDDTGEPLC